VRFIRYERHEFVWTPRKQAAAARRLQRERDAAPLFADLIAAEQPSLEEIHRARVAAVVKTERQARQRLAAAWRKVRAQVWEIPSRDRAALLAYWNEHQHFPGTPFYLGYVVRQYRAGGLAALGSGQF